MIVKNQYSDCGAGCFLNIKFEMPIKAWAVEMEISGDKYLLIDPKKFNDDDFQKYVAQRNLCDDWKGKLLVECEKYNNFHISPEKTGVEILATHI